MGLFNRFFASGKPERTPDLVVNGEKQITLRKICAVMQIDVPRKFHSIQDEINNDLVLAKKRIQPGSIYFAMFNNIRVKPHLENAIKLGAKVIFIEKKRFEKSGLHERDYPVILMQDPINQVGEVFSRIRKSYPAKTIAITGTVGKTTTNQLSKAMIAPEYRTYASAGNMNSFPAVANHIVNKLTEKHEVYIQEVGAADLNSVRKAGCMLRPDAFILLNVTNHHMNKYGTYEKLFEDKSSIDDYLSEDGVVIANFDDAGIASHTFKHRVISFGIQTDREVDFRGINIAQNGDLLELDVVHDGTMAHLKIHVLGEHNAYNALAAFAAAKWLDIDDQRIAQNALAYRTTGIRQNFQNIGGRYLYVDCYNVCEASLLATLHAIEAFPVAEGNKKIALLGGENKMGAVAAEAHMRFGQEIAQTDMDRYALFGTLEKDQASIDRYGDAFSMLKGMQEEGKTNVDIFTSLEEVTQYLQQTVNRGDVVLIKVILWLDVAVAIDKAFGTGFSYDYPYYATRTTPLQEGDWHAHVIPELGEAEILSVDSIGSELAIPDRIEGYPVFRIGKKSFRGAKSLRTLSLGSSLQNIGVGGFENCPLLETLVIPGNVKVIEDQAFRKCTGLQSVTLEAGVTHVAQEAFSGCRNLERIEIPDSVGQIGVDAFAGCERITIYCNPGSFAASYASENHLRCAPLCAAQA